MGNDQITELEPPNYPHNSIIIKHSYAWRNCACPHGCSGPVIPSWSAMEINKSSHNWWYDAGLSEETLNEEIERINKKASDFQMMQNWKNNGYIAGYICYVLWILMSIGACITVILLEKAGWIFLVVVVIMLAIMFINLAVCEWHKYLWNLCVNDIENNIANELNARYAENKVCWSVHSRIVQHGQADKSTKGGNYAYKRKYVDIVCVAKHETQIQVVVVVQPAIR